MNPLVPSVAFALLPAAAAVLGGLAALLRPPGAALRSAVQHFTAGVLFCAIATEILPDVVHRRLPVVTILSFAVGVGVMLAIKHWAEVVSRIEGSATRRPTGLIVTTGVDLALDGLLIALAFIGGQKQGVLIVIALALETFFLGLSAAAALAKADAGRARIAAVTAGFAVLLIIGTGVGAFFFMGAAGAVLDGLLSFGLAALLFLVTEELLVEAHETPETPVLTAMFFLGFVVLLGIEMFV